MRTVYPNLGFMSDNGTRTVIFTHGHFVESIYTLMSSLRKLLFPTSQTPTAIWDIEEENFAWIDFFWSTMGRSGAVGQDVERIYMMLLVPQMRNKLAYRLGELIADALMGHIHIPGAGGLLGLVVAHLLGHGGGLEKTRHEKPLSEDAERGLKAYVEGPLRKQFASDKKTIPGQATVIFGHTHKPFVQRMAFAGFPEQTAVFNTGGWVVDTEQVASTHGASIVVVDEDWNVAALRVYNEGDYAVKVESSDTDPRSNDLYKQLSFHLAQHAGPWKSLSTAIADTVNTYQENFRRRLRVLEGS